MKHLIQATGSRKTATANARLCVGKGEVFVNKRPLAKHFPLPHLIATVMQPLQIVDELNTYDIHIRVKGGGTTGQAEASRHAIARAIVKLNPDCHAMLKKHDLLTRDPRMVERKKYGQPKARKKFTWVKR